MLNDLRDDDDVVITSDEAKTMRGHKKRRKSLSVDLRFQFLHKVAFTRMMLCRRRQWATLTPRTMRVTK